MASLFNVRCLVLCNALFASGNEVRNIKEYPVRWRPRCNKLWRNSKFQQANGAGCQTKMHNASKYNNACFRYYIKVNNHVLVFHTKIQFTVYLLFLPAC